MRFVKLMWAKKWTLLLTLLGGIPKVAQYIWSSWASDATAKKTNDLLGRSQVTDGMFQLLVVMASHPASTVLLILSGIVVVGAIVSGVEIKRGHAGPQDYVKARGDKLQSMSENWLVFKIAEFESAIFECKCGTRVSFVPGKEVAGVNERMCP